jgi:nuclear RNA export factor
MCADEGMAVVHRFLQQYYQLYDSDKREELIVAYHDSAMLSVTSTYPEGQRSTATSE